MNTRTEIIRIGDRLMREKGYNAFSFSDISKTLQIKNASIHYHFPSKISLGLAVINDHQGKLDALMEKSRAKDALTQLSSFFSIYSAAKKENQICLVGSLATDLYTVDEEIQKALKVLTDSILQWVIQILDEGKAAGLFHFAIASRIKALMIITNMMAAVQLTRLTNKGDFESIKQTIVNDLTINK